MNKIGIAKNIDYQFEHMTNALNSILFEHEDKTNGQDLIDEFRDWLPIITSEIKSWIVRNPESEGNLYDYLKNEIERVDDRLSNGYFNFKDERLTCLQLLSQTIGKLFNKPIVSTIKLKINANNNVIYDLIKQLKTIVIQGKNPILTQSYEEIAEFLKLNISNFESTDITTISKELAREQTIKKGRLVLKTE